MDRFIGLIGGLSFFSIPYLKSNMDRFIVVFLMLLLPAMSYLKSNMDRFIEQLLAYWAFKPCI